MSEHKKLYHNALANVSQSIVGVLLMFILYRYINLTLGVDKLGVWSVVIAAVSASRLADFGLSASVTRFVARYLALDETENALKIVDTAVITLLVIVGIFLPLFYPLVTSVIGYLFQGVYVGLATDILPYAMVSLWFTVGASVFQGGLDGCQRMDIRATLVISGQGLLLTLSFLLIPDYGLLGLAGAQLCQSAFYLIVGRLLLFRTFSTISFLPKRWSLSTLREMLGYGVNLQLATVFMLLFDTLTKMLMTRFGGPSAAGYFEMANQVVIKARSLIVSANNAVVPHVAKLVETAPDQISKLYGANLRLLIYVVFPVFSLIITYSGVVSWLLTGEYNQTLTFLIFLLSIAWAVNTLTVPAYFINVGSGHVGWNTISHLIVGVMNVILGILLGYLFAEQGVAFGYVIALVSGSLVLQIAFNYHNKVVIDRDLILENRILGTVCTTLILLSFLNPIKSTTELTLIAVGVRLIPIMILGVVAYMHPMRRQLKLG